MAGKQTKARARNTLSRRPIRRGPVAGRSGSRSGAGAKARSKLLASVEAGRKGPRSVQAVRAGFGLSREKFSRLTGFSVRALAAWEGGELEPGGQARRRFAELSRLLDALSGVVRGDAVPPWMEAPNPSFDGLKPLEVIERGQIDRLWRMVYELESGAGF